MPKYHIEMRVVEIHDYEVEADSKDEAIDMIYDLDLKPNFVEPICYEVDDVWEAVPAEEALTPAEYDKLRTENLDWLAGKEK
jgi:hypothetical protein